MLKLSEYPKSVTDPNVLNEKFVGKTIVTINLAYELQGPIFINFNETLDVSIILNVYQVFERSR